LKAPTAGNAEIPGAAEGVATGKVAKGALVVDTFVTEADSWGAADIVFDAVEASTSPTTAGNASGKGAVGSSLKKGDSETISP
jgi:hypothetical protein